MCKSDLNRSNIGNFWNKLNLKKDDYVNFIMFILKYVIYVEIDWVFLCDCYRIMVLINMV